MSSIYDGKEINGKWFGGHHLQETWKFIDGVWRIVWQAIRSCFGRGFWANDKSWDNYDGWRNM